MANVDSAAPLVAQFMRVLNVVTVSSRMDVKPTVGLGFTQVGISLPFPSNFAGFENAGGTAVALGNPSTRGGISADSVNDRAELRFVSDSSVTAAFAYHFTYRII